MIKNYFKMAWRSLWKNRFYNALSLTGLSVGLTAVIFIAFWIDSELSYNDLGEYSENIYRVSSHIDSGGDIQTWGSSVGPVAYFAKKEIPEVKNAVRVRENWSYRIFSVGDNNLEAEAAVYVDPDFFKMFRVNFLKGTIQEPFSGNTTIVITQAAAEKYFGESNPLGKTITADYKDALTVVGVVEDLPGNSSVNYEIFFPMSILEQGYSENRFWDSMDSDWGNFNHITYLELNENTSANKVVDALTNINKTNDPNPGLTGDQAAYYLQSIQNMQLYSYGGDPTRINTVKIFGIVLLLILCIACINYVNLNTARAIQRAKEVSLRKLIGAERRHLFLQFIMESFIFFLLAMMLAVGFIFLLAPFFNSLSGKNIDFNFFDPLLWLMVLSVFLITLIASSIYPAILLSSFKPLEAIKGKVAPGIGTGNFRKVLVCVQFSFSVILIISTLVIGRQLEFINSKDPGYDRSQILHFSLSSEMMEHHQAVKNRIMNLPGVSGITFSNNSVVRNATTTGDTKWEGENPQSGLVVSPFGVNEDFIPLLQMKLKAGKNFSGTAADSTHFILNETAVNLAGLKDPIGKSFYLWEIKGTIIGVVKDFNFSSMREVIEPAVIYYDPEPYQIYIKTVNGDVAGTIASLEGIWNSYNAGYPFNYSFLDEEFESMHRDELRTGALFNIFSGLAIFVSCLGLFGLATYSAQLRIKEVGIRKVLGASNYRITHLLSIDFLKLVLIAAIIAAPIAWYAMSTWLQGFSYKTELSWWIFILAGVLAVVVALLTVSFQALKAALQNPIKSLRTE